MIFGKKPAKIEKKTAPPNTEPSIEKYSLKEDDVYVMPNKFVAVKAPAANPAKRGALALVLLVIFLGLLVGGSLWFLTKYQIKPENTTPTDNTTTNANTNVDSNVNNSKANINENLNESNNKNGNQNGNFSVNINDNTNQTPIIVNLDIDNDGLTDLEETLYKTDSQVADTDKDGYSDGQEIVSLYNPLVSGGRLSDSGLVSKYTNSSFSYELLYPKAWLVKSLNEDRSQVSLISDAGTGETMDISVVPNTEHLELADWRKTLYSNNQDMENFSVASRPALRSQDGRQVLLVTYDNVYTIIYDTTADRNFMATFNMILGSFKLMVK
ncbi:MAG: hypothetical protein WC465_01690 [Patescibacteria group bacterium]